jgi:UDPglucose--hexose-1-phosphate uridylyltransferase
VSEIRFDPLSGRWVILAPERAARPRERPAGNVTPCPFCPGHESETPPEVARWPAEPEPWQVRVVPNKFGALAGDSEAARAIDADGFVSMPGIGRHEVVVESPSHEWDFAGASAAEIERVLVAYQDRQRALRAAGAPAVIVFRNHGEAAGTSIRHPHSQIIACPVVPDRIREQTEAATRHFDRYGRSLYADIVEREVRSGTRVVLRTDEHIVFQPFASTVPHETWFVPRTAAPSFASASDEARADLAHAFQRTLAAMARLLDDPAYNLVVESAASRDEDLPYLSWYVRLLPRLTVPAGFELGSGVSIVPAAPEDTAAQLRAALEE